MVSHDLRCSNFKRVADFYVSCLRLTTKTRTRKLGDLWEMEPRLEEIMPAAEIPGQRRKSFKRIRGNNSEHSSYIGPRNRTILEEITRETEQIGFDF